MTSYTLKNSDRPSLSRHSIRLSDVDYSKPGTFFITLVTFHREHLLGEIRDGRMFESEAGQVVWDIWRMLPERYPRISLGKAVVMPNHFHAVIKIMDGNDSGEVVAAIHELPLQQKQDTFRLARRRMLLPKAVGFLKMNSAKRINLLFNSSGVPVWQRNYYEHILRTPEELHSFEQYILANPSAWTNDEENTNSKVDSC